MNSLNSIYYNRKNICYYLPLSCITNVGLERLIAKTEEEYVKLALQLAADVSALSELRMSLRELMAKSPVCNGAKFTRDLESLYRIMWKRYCRGDVPALKNLEALQLQQPQPDKISIMFSDIAKSTIVEENHQPTVKMNGVSSVSSSSLNLSSSEASHNQVVNGVKLS